MTLLRRFDVTLTLLLRRVSARMSYWGCCALLSTAFMYTLFIYVSNIYKLFYEFDTHGWYFLLPELIVYLILSKLSANNICTVFSHWPRPLLLNHRYKTGPGHTNVSLCWFHNVFILVQLVVACSQDRYKHYTRVYTFVYIMTLGSRTGPALLSYIAYFMCLTFDKA